MKQNVVVDLVSLGITPRAGFGGGVQLLAPVRPVFMAVLFHEDFEKAEVIQPGGFLFAEGLKLGHSPSLAFDLTEGTAQQRVFQPPHLGVVYRAMAQQIHAQNAGDAAVEFFVQLRHHRRGEIERQVIQRDGADGVVGAAIAAGGVDGQKLDKAEAGVGGPVDELTHAADVANAEVIGRAQGENWDQNACTARLNGRHERVGGFQNDN